MIAWSPAAGLASGVDDAENSRPHGCPASQEAPLARLTTKERNALKPSQFAGPNRSYPVEDKSHARDAKSRASEEEHKGKISKGEERSIDRKADKELRKGRGK